MPSAAYTVPPDAVTLARPHRAIGDPGKVNRMPVIAAVIRGDNSELIDAGIEVGRKIRIDRDIVGRAVALETGTSSLSRERDVRPGIRAVGRAP